MKTSVPSITTTTANQNALKKEFNDVYQNSYGKPFAFHDNDIVSIHEVTITEGDVIAENVVIGAVGALITVVAPEIGIPADVALIASVAFPACVSSVVLGAGTYPVYTIERKGINYYDVEVANYHGYRVFEQRAFDYSTTYSFYVLNGKIAQTSISEYDAFLAYKYRNHN